MNSPENKEKSVAFQLLTYAWFRARLLVQRKKADDLPGKSFTPVYAPEESGKGRERRRGETTCWDGSGQGEGVNYRGFASPL